MSNIQIKNKIKYQFFLEGALGLDELRSLICLDMSKVFEGTCKHDIGHVHISQWLVFDLVYL